MRARHRPTTTGRARSALLAAFTLVLALALTSAPAHAQTETGFVLAWGQNAPHDQLGTGYRGSYAVSPLPALGLSGITQVAMGANDGYALTEGATVYSWGGNTFGQLGAGPTERGEARATPEPIYGFAGEVKEVAAAGYHAVALLKDEEVITWGSGTNGELGNGTQKGSPEPNKYPKLTGVQKVAAGGATDFALKTDGTLWVWGRGSSGMLGGAAETSCPGETPTHPQPCDTRPQEVDLPAGAVVTQISAGKEAAYALLNSGKVLAWGANNADQLGYETQEKGSAEPKQVNLAAVERETGGTATVVEVSGGENHALARLQDGQVISWGSNYRGQLGPGSSEGCAKGRCLTPKVVGGLGTAQQVAAGGAFSLVLSGGEIYAFGENEHGQLGDGNTKNTNVPTVIDTTGAQLGNQEAREPLTGVTRVTAGSGELPYMSSSLAIVEKQPPPPPVSVIAEKESLLLIWRVTTLLGAAHPNQYPIKWRLASLKGENATWENPPEGPETAENPEVKNKRIDEKHACSVSEPCTYRIKAYNRESRSGPLEPEKLYEVRFSLGEGEGLAFAYGEPLCGKPTVTGVSPNEGPLAGGRSVTITGTNFCAGALVDFGSLAAEPPLEHSLTSLTVTSPTSEQTGTVDVTVEGEETSAVNAADRFTFVPPPSITKVTPSTGPAAGGAPVVIEGSNFTSVTAVRFGSVNATTFTVNSPTMITAVSPAGNGTVDVSVTTEAGGASAAGGADRFSYLEAP